ncbi:MAG: FecR domain-containing protein [Sphingomonas sp.]
MESETAAQIEEASCRWAARLDRGLSTDESVELGDWLAGDTRRRGALLRAQAMMSMLDRGRALGAQEEMLAEAPGIARRRLLWAGGGVAAALALGVGWSLWPVGTSVETAVGEIREIALEDGSHAAVNSASKVHFAFDAKTRNVKLAVGEAWFKVAKNRVRPFVVSVGPVRVEAVGTAFDVRRHESASEVIVTEGVVQIWPATGRPFLLAKGYRASVGDYGALQTNAVPDDKAGQRLAWRERRVVLDDMTLAAAAEEFNRYHAVRLQVDPSLAGRHVVGSFQTDDLDGFANASAALVGGHVERDGGAIRIVP